MLAVALASGGLAALLAMRYLRQQNAARGPADPANMVVAARPLPVGTILAEQHVKTIEWTGGACRSANRERPGRGRPGLISLQENEPLLESKLAPKGPAVGSPSSSARGSAASPCG